MILKALRHLVQDFCAKTLQQYSFLQAH